MSTSIAALIAIAAVAVTYYSCVRPMRRGHEQRAAERLGASDAELDRQIADLREELRVLRAQDTLDGRRPST